jgi:hypothetical protein
MVNSRLISSLFEKPILKRIIKIQKDINMNITGAYQHGFKTGRSTATLSAELQSIKAMPLDNVEYNLVASLE